MKELSIEEKAKAYDEAIERAKNFIENGDERERTVAESIFAGIMEESEDERIRKELISLFQDGMDGVTHRYTGSDSRRWLAWLEKQGEQKFADGTFVNVDDVREDFVQEVYRVLDADSTNDRANQIIDAFDNLPTVTIERQDEQKPADKVAPKFKVGDWVVWDNKISCHVDNIYQGKESLMYTITDVNNMTRSYSVKGFDNNVHLWTIQDAKDGDVLVSRSPFIYGKQCPYGGLNWCNDKFIKASNFIFTDSPVHPATKEQRELLFQKMKEAGYEWNAENKQLKKIERNPTDEEMKELLHTEYEKGRADAIAEMQNALSEDDEREVAVLEAYIRSKDWSDRHIDRALGIVDELANKLKSLRLQNVWKPSDGQMESITCAVRKMKESACYDSELVWLLNDLKKLRNE